MNLSTIAGGLLQATFNRNYNEVLENIKDEATEATAKRKITIDVTLVPDEKRNMIKTTFSIRRKTAPIVDVGTVMLVKQDGNMIWTEEWSDHQIPGQVVADNLSELPQNAELYAK
jgi:hypothetical protein